MHAQLLDVEAQQVGESTASINGNTQTMALCVWNGNIEVIAFQMMQQYSYDGKLCGNDKTNLEELKTGEWSQDIRFAVRHNIHMIFSLPSATPLYGVPITLSMKLTLIVVPTTHPMYIILIHVQNSHPINPTLVRRT